MDMITRMLDSWTSNCRINTALLAAIPDEGLLCIPLLKSGKPGRGRNVARVFLHMSDSRMYHMRKAEKQSAGDMPKLGKGETPVRKQIEQALGVSAKAVELRLSGAVADGLSIHKQHPAQFLAYLIAHDSHHRGQIMLALKQNGIKVTDDAKWGLWSGWFK